ncbi:MAG: hypothetical protein J5879_08820 [Clostridia bacterium]|nr:hypothetical protein [Clostridia bacterium]
MQKRIIAIILLSVLLITAAGCASDNGTQVTVTDAESGNDMQYTPENATVITDENGAKLGAIENGAAVTAACGGIFYSVMTIKEYSFTGTAEYRFFSLSDKTDVFLGKLEDQGYEAGYARTELNGVIYTLAVKGDPGGEGAVPLLLLAFDAANKTMSTYTVSEYGFPYAAMTSSGGKLLIMNHETTKEKEDKIYEFDPDSKTVKEVLTFSSSSDSLRSVCAADDGFYLLRLKVNNGGENEMYVDLYDGKYVKRSEQPVNDVLADAIKEVRGITGRGDALNELGMNVSRFAVIGGRYMIYENFGLSRVAVDLQTKQTIFAEDDNYSVSTGSGAPLIYRLDFDADNVPASEIYRMENGRLAQVPFTPDGAHRLIQFVTVSEDGTMAVMSVDTYPARNGSAVIRVIPAER